MVQFYLDAERVPALISHLMAHKKVIAPHLKGRQSISFEPVTDPECVVLDYSRTMQSIRKFFLPPKEELLTFDLQENSYDVTPVEPVNAIFFGVHSYDLAAVGRLDYNSAPSMDEFDQVIECDSIGNYSSLMLRTDHAWHAVNPIDCPEDRLRRVFIVVVNPDSLFWKVRDRVIGKTIQRF